MITRHITLRGLVGSIGKASILMWGLIGYVVVSLYESLSITIFIFSIFCFFMVWVFGDNKFTNPVSIYSLFLYPYSTWFIYYSMLEGGADIAKLDESLRLSFLGLLSFCIVGYLTQAIIRAREMSWAFTKSFLLSAPASLKILSAPAVIVIVLAIVEVLISGASTKRQILDGHYFFASFSDFGAVLLTTGALLLLVRGVAVSRGIAGYLNPYYIGALIVLTAGFLFLGERDFLFRIAFCSLVIFFDKTRLASFFVLLSVLTGLSLILPATQAAKGLLLPGADFSVNYGWSDIFYGEFISAGRNVYMLLVHGVEHSYSYLVSDIVRALVPFSASYGYQSSGAWYNEIYRVQHGFSGVAGWGFSIIAQGYLIGGEVGVIIVMSLVSLILNLLYLHRYRSEFWFVFYLIALSVAIYTIRSDFANFVSQTFKIGGLAVALYWLVSWTFSRLNNGQVRLEVNK